MSLITTTEAAIFICDACTASAEMKLWTGRPVGWGRLDINAGGTGMISHDLCKECVEKALKFMGDNVIRIATNIQKRD